MSTTSAGIKAPIFLILRPDIRTRGINRCIARAEIISEVERKAISATTKEINAIVAN